jgi:hypothetical protein
MALVHQQKCNFREQDRGLGYQLAARRIRKVGSLYVENGSFEEND